jgi:hypothetical protein
VKMDNVDLPHALLALGYGLITLAYILQDWR